MTQRWPGAIATGLPLMMAVQRGSACDGQETFSDVGRSCRAVIMGAGAAVGGWVGAVGGGTWSHPPSTNQQTPLLRKIWNIVRC